MSSDEDIPALMAAFKKGRRKEKQASPGPTTQPSPLPVSYASGSPPESPENIDVICPLPPRRLAHIRVSPVRSKHEYTYYEPEEEVMEILDESSKRGEMLYRIRLVDSTEKEVSERGKTPIEQESSGAGKGGQH